MYLTEQIILDREDNAIFLSRAVSRAIWAARLLGGGGGGALVSRGGARAASRLGVAVESELEGVELGRRRRANSSAERWISRAVLAWRRLLTFRAHLTATLFEERALAPA